MIVVGDDGACGASRYRSVRGIDVARRGDVGQVGKQFGHARFMIMLNRILFVVVGQCSQTCHDWWMPYEIVADEKAGVRVVLNKARLSDAPLGDYGSLVEAEAFVKTMREIDAIGASPVRMPPQA